MLYRFLFVSDAKVNATIDGVNEDVFKIIDDQFNEQANPVGSGKSTEVVAPYLPSCATVTTTVTGSTWTRTVVFDNCTLQNGNVLDGTILISGSTNFDTPSQTISYTFENFHHNDILIEGNRTVLRTIQSTEALSTPHPDANMDIDMTATFPNGNVYHRVGNRIREMIEGVLSEMIEHYSREDETFNEYPDFNDTAELLTQLFLKELKKGINK